MAKPLIDFVRLGKGGQLTLSRRVRSSLGLREGEDLMVTVDDRRIVLERRARNFRTYIEKLSERPSEETPEPRPEGSNAQRRGLGRFLTR